MPIEPRTASRLLVLDRGDGSLEHGRFSELTGFLRTGDVLVFNDSRVIPARLMGMRDKGGEVEILLLRRLESGIWETLVKPGRRVKAGTIIEIAPSDGERQDKTVTAEAVGLGEGGTRLMRFSDDASLPGLGKVALPPYIHTPLDDPQRYQTVYAEADGSVAAPTAGLHFTPEMLSEIEKMGAHCLFVTLHIGLDTFRPVREEDPLKHPIHREYGVISRETAAEINGAIKEDRRLICVGTTSVRLLEAAARASGPADLQPFQGWVDLFITPGYHFRLTDALVTNFHLPRSTLLMLVSAFAGTENIKKAYRQAIARRYRFYSFGDAMLII